MDHADAKYANRILGNLAAHNEARLRTGLQRRQAIMELLENGIEPDGPRIEWLRQTTMAIIDTLAAQALVFNEEYCDDLISSADMVDALTSALGMLGYPLPTK